MFRKSKIVKSAGSITIWQETLDIKSFQPELSDFVDEECLDVVARRFSKICRHTPGISRIFESLMVQQISANRRKNRSIQVQQFGQYGG